jgi:hypothetical protein
LRAVDVEQSHWEHRVMVVSGEAGITTLVEVKSRMVPLTHGPHDLWSPISIRALHRGGAAVETDDDGSFMIRELRLVWYFEDERIVSVSSPSADWLEAEGLAWRHAVPPS